MLIKRIIFYLKTKSLISSKIKYLFLGIIHSFFHITSKHFFHSLFPLANYVGNIKIRTVTKDKCSYIHKIENMNGLYDIYQLQTHKFFTPKEDDILFDIGSHIGAYTLKNSKLIKKGKVFSFEPDTEAYRMLTKNIKLSNAKNIKPFKIAVSDKEGEKQLYATKFGTGGSSLFLTERERELNVSEKVKIISLDSFVKNNKINKIDIIKMDTEGAEILILKGAKKSLKKFKPKLIIEPHPNVYDIEELKNTLKKLGYQIFEHQVAKNTIPFIFAEKKDNI